MELHFYFLALIASLCTNLNAMENQAAKKRPTQISIVVAYSSAGRAFKRTITTPAPLSTQQLDTIHNFVAGKQSPFWTNILKDSEDPIAKAVDRGDEIKDILDDFFNHNNCLPEQKPTKEIILKIVLNHYNSSK